MANRDERRANALTIPLSPKEKEDIRTLASKKGMTMATYARMLLNEQVRKECEK